MSTKGRILVVDDNPHIKDIVTEFFNEYEVLRAADGFEAVELTNSIKKFDLIILDLELPNHDGPCFLELLQKKDSTPPICVISSNRETQSRDGSFSHLCRPIGINPLIEQCVALLSKEDEIETEITWA